MSLIVVGSVKGSPGATTTAVALGAAWPTGAPVIVEADPAGGDLAARFALALEPGLVSLASACRRGLDPEAMWAHTQPLADGLVVVAGPASAKQARAALAMAIPVVAEAWAAAERLVLTDCGRLDPTSPALDLLAHADVVVVVVRPALADVRHLAARVGDLRGRAGDVVVVACGAGPYEPGEISDALGVEVVGALPDDPVGAELFGGAAGSPRRLGRTPLARAARSLAETLAHRLPVTTTTPASSSPVPLADMETQGVRR